MRKLSLFLLLATSAVPAVAQRHGDGDRTSRSSSQSEQSNDRPQRAERSERIERREAREQPQRQMQVERHQVQRQMGDQQLNDAAVAAMRERYQQAQQQQGEQQQGRSVRAERLQRYQEQQQQQQQQQQQVQGEATRSERLERYRQRQLEANQQIEGGGLVPRQSRIRSIPSTTPEVGQSGPTRTDVGVVTRHDRPDRNRWSNHWRTDRRYDWRRHRDRNRSIFRIGFYYDPFGYSYRRFGLGSFLYSNYYQSNYWISDPWQYRLPPAYGPYRWVRYHNDAVLVDTWTGEVLDVIYGFFW